MMKVPCTGMMVVVLLDRAGANGLLGNKFIYTCLDVRINSKRIQIRRKKRLIKYALCDIILSYRLYRIDQYHWYLHIFCFENKLVQTELKQCKKEIFEMVWK